MDFDETAIPDYGGDPASFQCIKMAVSKLAEKTPQAEGPVVNRTILYSVCKGCEVFLSVKGQVFDPQIRLMAAAWMLKLESIRGIASPELFRIRATDFL